MLSEWFLLKQEIKLSTSKMDRVRAAITRLEADIKLALDLVSR